MGKGLGMDDRYRYDSLLANKKYVTPMRASDVLGIGERMLLILVERDNVPSIKEGSYGYLIPSDVLTTLDVDNNYSFYGTSPDGAVTIKEAANILKVSYNSIQKYLKEDKLEALIVGKRRFVTTESIERFKRERPKTRTIHKRRNAPKEFFDTSIFE